jgi:hypothetical protein
MTTTADRRGPVTLRRYVSDREIEIEVAREVRGMRDQAGIEARPEPRCRVCQQETSRALVNRMLAHAFSYAEIAEAVDLVINPHRSKNSQVSYKSIFYHAKRHFNLEEPAKAAYRRILERRRATVETWADGVGHLITALGYLDVMAQKGYQTLVAEDTVISPTVGMEAVIRLHELSRQQAGQQAEAELRQQLAVSKSAVKEVVPEQYWALIIASIEEAEGRTAPDILDAEVLDDDYDDDGEGFSPPVETDTDDTLES